MRKPSTWHCRRGRTTANLAECLAAGLEPCTCTGTCTVPSYLLLLWARAWKFQSVRLSHLNSFSSLNKFGTCLTKKVGGEQTYQRCTSTPYLLARHVHSCIWRTKKKCSPCFIYAHRPNEKNRWSIFLRLSLVHEAKARLVRPEIHVFLHCISNLLLQETLRFSFLHLRFMIRPMVWCQEHAVK